MSLLSYRQPQVSSWLVFAGMIAHVSVQQQAGAAVEKIIYHPRYDDRSHDYDIALMKLTAPLNFSGETLLFSHLPFGGGGGSPQSSPMASIHKGATHQWSDSHAGGLCRSQGQCQNEGWSSCGELWAAERKLSPGKPRGLC